MAGGPRSSGYEDACSLKSTRVGVAAVCMMRVGSGGSCAACGPTCACARACAATWRGNMSPVAEAPPAPAPSNVYARRFCCARMAARARSSLLSIWRSRSVAAAAGAEAGEEAGGGAVKLEVSGRSVRGGVATRRLGVEAAAAWVGACERGHSHSLGCLLCFTGVSLRCSRVKRVPEHVIPA